MGVSWMQSQLSYTFTCFLIFVVLGFQGCSNSVDPETTITQSPVVAEQFPQAHITFNESESLYVGLPRILIETNNLQEIENRETDIPATFQVWGKNGPLDSKKNLVIRGRGNSSWDVMPKKSYRLEFAEKYEVLGMHANKDWALIANFADKTYLKNFITQKLSKWLKMYYTPAAEFVELYINGTYQGLYQITETVKVDKYRVNIPSDANFIEKTSAESQKDDQVCFTSTLKFFFCFKQPKNATDEQVQKVRTRINNLENYLYRQENFSEEELLCRVDLNTFTPYYWIQEFSKNQDGAFWRSIYISWSGNQPMRWGPVWDFDIAYGTTTDTTEIGPQDWLTRENGWFKYFFENSLVQKQIKDYWQENKSIFTMLPDTISHYAKMLAPAIRHDQSVWPTLKSSAYIFFKDTYNSHEEAVDSLNSWIRERYQWIDEQYK